MQNQNNNIPIEYHNVYPLQKTVLPDDGCMRIIRKDNEYIWKTKISDWRGYYGINIWSTFDLKNIYISIYEYLLLLQDIINDNLIDEKNILNNEQIAVKFHIFRNNYRINLLEREKYDINILKTCYKFIKNKFGLENPVRYDGFFENFDEKQRQFYFEANRSFTNKIIIIAINTQMGTFVSRFIFNNDNILQL